MLYRESAAAPAEEEQSKRIKQLERALGPSRLQIEILKDVLRGVSCGQAHSPALQFVVQSGEARLVAETIRHQQVVFVLPAKTTRLAGRPQLT